MSLWRFPCDDPACDGWERVHRPYASARGKNHKHSVSEFADLVAGGGDGLVFHGAREAATVAYWQRDTLAEMDLDDAVGKVTRTVAAMRKTDGDLGTSAHLAPEAWAVDAEWNENGDWYDHDRLRLWNFVSGIARWWEHRLPVVLTCEFIVSNDDPSYVGTGDMIALIDGEVVYVDWKTHRRHKADEKAAFGKWQVQTNMLSLARDLRHYHGGKLIDTVAWDDTDLPRPTRGLIVSVGPEGQVREYGCDIDPAMMPLVASMGAVLEFKPQMRQLLGVPIVAPKYEPRPDAPVSVDAMLG